MKEKSNVITIDNNGLYSIDVKDIHLIPLLDEFFTKSGREYSIQGRNNNIIRQIKFSNKSFDELLDLIMEEGSSDYSESGGVYYIFDLSREEIANRHLITKVIKLQNIKVKDLINIITREVSYRKHNKN